MVLVVMVVAMQYISRHGAEIHLLIAFTFALYLHSTEAPKQPRSNAKDLWLPTIPIETLHKVRHQRRFIVHLAKLLFHPNTRDAYRQTIMVDFTIEQNKRR